MENGSNDVYKPLDPKRNEIRILRLKPTNCRNDRQQHEDHLECLLEHRSLDDLFEYTALSYAWQNGSPPQKISLSGFEQLVSANLADALRQLRRESEDVVIWADQLCINQNDDVEKASQIHEMGRIYENATCVIAWLGVSSADSDLVITTLRHLAKQEYEVLLSNVRLLLDIAQELDESSPTSSVTTPTKWHSVELLARLKDALPAFTTRGYWTRLWVLQEYVLGKSVSIMCGSRTIDDIAFGRAWYVLEEAANATESHLDSASLLPDVIAIGEVWRRYPSWWDAWLGIHRLIIRRQKHHSRQEERDHTRMEGDKLLQVMFSALTTISGENRLLCADARDRVFGCLGLATDSTDFNNFPDYSRSTESIYEELAQKFIQQGHIDALSYCQENINNRSRSMASWAADWALKIRLPLWGKLPIDASLGWTANLSPYPLDGKSIRVHGACVGKVQSHGYHTSPTEALTLGEMELFLHHIQKFCNQSSLIHVDEKEIACSKIAAPGAKSYLDDDIPLLTQYRDILEHIKDGFPASSPESEPGAKKQYLSPFERELQLQLLRCPFITTNGYVGIAQPYVEDGDWLCIFPGGHQPYILRPVTNNNCFRVISAAYVYSIMQGEYFATDRESMPLILY